MSSILRPARRWRERARQGGRRVRRCARSSCAPRRAGGQRGDNSTIGVIATNAKLTKAQASSLAQLADDGYVRAIWPIHTRVDGDTVFAIATGTAPGERDMITLGALAADVMATAVIRAATQATGLPNLPAVRNLGAGPPRMKP